MFSNFEGNNNCKNNTNKKKIKKNQKNSTEGENNEIIKIDFGPSVYEDSIEEKKCK